MHEHVMDNVGGLINRLKLLSSIGCKSDVSFDCNISIRYNSGAFTESNGIFADALNKVLNRRRDELLKEICAEARETIVSYCHKEANRLQEELDDMPTNSC